MYIIISTLTIDHLLSSINYNIDNTQSIRDKIQKLIQNNLLLSNVSYQVKEINEVFHPIQLNKSDDSVINFEHDNNHEDDCHIDHEFNYDSHHDDSDDDHDIKINKRVYKNCVCCIDDSDEDYENDDKDIQINKRVYKNSECCSDAD